MSFYALYELRSGSMKKGTKVPRFSYNPIGSPSINHTISISVHPTKNTME